MNLRTTIKINPAEIKIDYKSPVMFIGSCFATEIGKKMEDGHLTVLINPFGTVYNPVSVSKTLELIINNKKYSDEDLYNNNGEYLSFNHYTNFTSSDRVRCLAGINDSTQKAHNFLTKAKLLFITFGTARVYRFNETGEIVSNCHKLDPYLFTREMVSVEEIVLKWKKLIQNLKSFNSNLNIVFTVSPVRHWKDGAHGNQISKSVLFLAIEELLNEAENINYFPAYELLMDDLRDYRFYAEDMLHPSQKAIAYIWEAFSNCYMDSSTVNIWNEVSKITKACQHRLNTESGSKISLFSEQMLKQISIIQKKYPLVDLSVEHKYFLGLTGKKN